VEGWGLSDLPIALSDTRSLVLTRYRFGFFLQDEEHDPQYEPVIHLTDKVETKTLEEDEDQLFKMCAASLDLLFSSYGILTYFRWLGLGAPNSSDLMHPAPNGRNEERASCVCLSTKRLEKFALSCGVTRHSRSALTT
jgi:hypothetical protein